ncbi:MAG: sensor histidine kinase [Bacteroidia bacterium]|nr:sensor histidine kinase [Bacteroidia bacterium]
MEKTRLIELKEQITHELKSETVNYDRVLSLSNELASQDNDHVRFSVDAAVIERLGYELVTKQEIAVSELVKNAYDADATEVILSFKDAETKGGTLTIEDDGNGMNRDQLVNGFMRISSSEKIDSPTSPLYGRTRAGRKGIGRFAVHRLGTKLTVITQAEDAIHALQVTIDWELFKRNQELFSISNKIIEIPKRKLHGTTLIIEQLRESWTDAEIKRSYRYVSDLLQPFPISESAKEKAEKRKGLDPGFKASFFRIDKDQLVSIADDQQNVFDHALAEIEGYVLDDKIGYWGVKSTKLELKFDELLGKDNKEGKKDVPFNQLKNIHFKAYYFIYAAGLLPRQTRSYIQEIAHEKGGIRLYRNGFRVLPYAERNDDWLKLDESTRKNQILPPHGNNNFFGFVEIFDQEGILFEEAANREGILQSEAFDELTDFIYRVLISAVSEVAQVRGKKVKASDKKNTSKKTLTEAFEEIENALTTNVASSKDESIAEKVERFKYRLTDNEKQIQELQEEINLLRVLASLGLMLGEFSHEAKNKISAIRSDVAHISEKIRSSQTVEEGLINSLLNHVNILRSYTGYFDKSVTSDYIRELKPVDLRRVVFEFKDMVQNDSKANKIEIKYKFEYPEIMLKPMHLSEWQSILLNLYTNSKKALNGKDNSIIFIRCGVAKNIAFLEFSDNGIGIPPQNHEKIFDAFFSTSLPKGYNASYAESMTGSGLGLKIVKDIVLSYDGDVYVSASEPGYATTIRVEFPVHLND